MLIECLVKRIGPTEVILDKVHLLFLPVPFISDGKGGQRPIKKDEPTTSVCNVDKDEHLDYFKKFPNTYREYKQGEPTPAELQDKKRVDLSGFALEKYSEGGKEGYVAFDKKKKLYHGQGGDWQDSKRGLFPFQSEIEAYQWLEEEGGARLPDEEPEMLTCPNCGKECKPQGFAAHMRACKGIEKKTE